MRLKKMKIGILGGGQLGKMLCLAAADWDLEIHILDPDPKCAARNYCTHFTEGSFKDYGTVVDFGRSVDMLTIEIEHVDEDALMALKQEGKIVHPSPESIFLIKDKGIQKILYKENGFPSSPFKYKEGDERLETFVMKNKINFPFVWKASRGGYDGKGVALVKTIEDLKQLPNVACIVEDFVDIEKEIAIIAVRNEKDEVVTYPAVEMLFDQKANLLDLQSCPADISHEIENQAKDLAIKLIRTYNICGLLAVEFFLTKQGTILVNEVAPRPHNSGHHTIEASETSQFQNHLRGILNTPLGSTKTRMPSVLLNLVGEEGYEGNALYVGMENALSIEGVHIHLYGKNTTKPWRKMGHVTTTADTIEDAMEKAMQVKSLLKVVC
jgi:5-(carboxyamino)imidazole ribonucleotide synthase